MPVMVIPLSEQFKLGPESLFCSNKIYWDKPEYLTIRNILYGYMHRLETTAKTDVSAIKCELLLTPVHNILVLYKRLGNSITELTQR